MISEGSLKTGVMILESLLIPNFWLVVYIDCIFCLNKFEFQIFLWPIFHSFWVSLLFNCTGQWRPDRNWTACDGSNCDQDRSFQWHWNCCRGGESSYRPWRCSQGLLCPPWFDICTESPLSQASKVYFWGTTETFLGAGCFKAVKKGSVTQV